MRSCRPKEKKTNSNGSMVQKRETINDTQLKKLTQARVVKKINGKY